MLYAERRDRLSAQGGRARSAELSILPDRASDVGAQCHQRQDVVDDSHRQATGRDSRRTLTRSIRRIEKGAPSFRVPPPSLLVGRDLSPRWWAVPEQIGRAHV